jgi:hypothetical protein
MQILPDVFLVNGFPYGLSQNGYVVRLGDVIVIGPECHSVALGWNGGPDYDRATYVQSPARLAHMDCDCLLPGHGPPCLNNGKRLVEIAYATAMTNLR